MVRTWAALAASEAEWALAVEAHGPPPSSFTTATAATTAGKSNSVNPAPASSAAAEPLPQRTTNQHRAIRAVAAHPDLNAVIQQFASSARDSAQEELAADEEAERLGAEVVSSQAVEKQRQPADVVTRGGEDSSSDSDDDFIRKKAAAARKRREAANSAGAETGAEFGERDDLKDEPRKKNVDVPKIKQVASEAVAAAPPSGESSKSKGTVSGPGADRRPSRVTSSSLEKEEAVDPMLRSDEFDVQKFITERLSDLSYGELKLCVEQWHRQQASRDTAIKDLIKENFDEFVQARNTLDAVHAHLLRMRSNTLVELRQTPPNHGLRDKHGQLLSAVVELSAPELAADTHSETQQLAHSFGSLRARSEGIYRTLITETDRANATRNVLGVLRLFHALLDLPRSLRQNIERDNAAEVIRLVEKSSSLIPRDMEIDVDALLAAEGEGGTTSASNDNETGSGTNNAMSAPVRVVVRVFGQMTRLLARYELRLRKQLSDPWLSPARQLSAVETLVALREAQAAAAVERAQRRTAGQPVRAPAAVLGSPPPQTSQLDTPSSRSGAQHKLKNLLHLRHKHDDKSKDKLVAPLPLRRSSISVDFGEPVDSLSRSGRQSYGSASRRSDHTPSGSPGRPVGFVGIKRESHPAVTLLQSRTSLLCKHFQRPREDAAKKLVECGGYFQQDFPIWWNIARKWLLHDPARSMPSDSRLWRESSSSMREIVATGLTRIMSNLKEVVREHVATLRGESVHYSLLGMERFGRAAATLTKARSILDNTLKATNSTLTREIDLMTQSADMTLLVTEVNDAFVQFASRYVLRAVCELLPSAPSGSAPPSLDSMHLADAFRAVILRAVAVVLSSVALTDGKLPGVRISNSRPVATSSKSSAVKFSSYQRDVEGPIRQCATQIMIEPMLVFSELLHAHFVRVREAAAIHDRSSASEAEVKRVSSRELLLCLATAVHFRGSVFPEILLDFLDSVTGAVKGVPRWREFVAELHKTIHDEGTADRSPLQAMANLCGEVARSYRARASTRMCAIIRSGVLQSGINWADLATEPSFCSDYVSKVLLSCVFVHAELREVLSFAAFDESGDDASDLRRLNRKFGAKKILSSIVADVIRAAWLPLATVLREALTDNYNGSQQFLADAEFFARVLRLFVPRWTWRPVGPATSEQIGETSEATSATVLVGSNAEPLDEHGKLDPKFQSPMSVVFTIVSGSCPDVLPDSAVRRRQRAVTKSIHRTKLLFQCFEA